MAPVGTDWRTEFSTLRTLELRDESSWPACRPRGQLPMIAPPRVQPFFHAATSTWSYLVDDAVHRQAAIIDPVLDFDAASGRVSTQSAQAIMNRVREHQLDVRWILETHAHADHLSAGDWLRRQLPGAQLAIGRGIGQVQKYFIALFNTGQQVADDGAQFDRLFDDGDIFAIGALAARVIAVPGHTADSVSYLIGDALFTGDSLFMPDGGTARCDFPGGSSVTLFRSIKRLYALPDATRVFVCHDYAPGGRAHACETTIAAQKRDNIHLRTTTSEVEYTALRDARDATLAVPALLLPALQVNIRAGALPIAEDNGVRYLKLPLTGEL